MVTSTQHYPQVRVEKEQESGSSEFLHQFNILVRKFHTHSNPYNELKKRQAIALPSHQLNRLGPACIHYYYYIRLIASRNKHQTEPNYLAEYLVDPKLNSVLLDSATV